MSDLQAAFHRAVAASRTLPETPGPRTLLQLYALYKQASDGDATGDRPGLADVVARAKWDAWRALQGQSKDAAMQAYVALVEDLMG